jgi:hypothetical protein
MEKIAIVDDNKEQRETNTIRLRLFLKQLHSNIEVIDVFPFEKYSDYYGFIDSEKIIALVIDEKLYNDSQADKEPVEYNGSDLVGYLRERYKYIPIFTLTNVPEDQILQEKINEYDYIFSKKEFSIKQVEIIQRACQRYLEENQKELSLFDDLTRKVASGKGEANDIERLKALQMKLHIPMSSDLKDREEWLNEYEKQIVALEELKSKLEKKLNKK